MDGLVYSFGTGADKELIYVDKNTPNAIPDAANKLGRSASDFHYEYDQHLDPVKNKPIVDDINRNGYHREKVTTGINFGKDRESKRIS